MLGCFSRNPDVDGEIPGRFAEILGCFGAMQVRIAHRKRYARSRHGDHTVIPAFATQRCHPDVHDRLPFRPQRRCDSWVQHACARMSRTRPQDDKNLMGRRLTSGADASRFRPARSWFPVALKNAGLTSFVGGSEST
jgi:hypothetical protein